ncbi:MAG TPA: DUF4202 family protein [Myxococcus sp.]|nr:DUF4202 family protein [Myxococcus sp.]
MLRQLLLSDFDTEGPAAGNGWELVQAEFPTVEVAPLTAGRGANVLRLDVSEWGGLEFDPFEWDARVFAAAEGCDRLALHLEGAWREALVIAALEILTRYQGLVGRRNAASADLLFNRLLACHRALHDLGRPPGRTDYQHALDVWQWVLRLRPDADFDVQAAALFHDVERPAHSARLARALLAQAGANEATCRRVNELVTRQGHPGEDADLALLGDADALSFFSLNSSGFVRYFDPEHSRRKVAWTLSRLRPGQLRRLSQMRLAPTVRGLLDAQLSSLAT